METDLKNERYVFYLNCSVYHNLQSQNDFTKWLFTCLELCLVVIKFIKFFFTAQIRYLQFQQIRSLYLFRRRSVH